MMVSEKVIWAAMLKIIGLLLDLKPFQIIEWDSQKMLFEQTSVSCCNFWFVIYFGCIVCLLHQETSYDIAGFSGI